MPNKNNILCLFALSAFISTPVFASLDRGLTPHFSAWLKNNGYGQFGFERTDLVGGAFGGKTSDDDVLKHNPVVFFHGNSDIAVGVNEEEKFTGFTKSIEYFLSQGYSKSELYITTWGPGDRTYSKMQVHSKEYLEYLRAFTEAVIAYTGADKINIVSHSMGVTLGRRVIKGGMVKAAPNPFNLGPSLADKVDTFIGIAGANWGLTNCYLFPGYQTCNNINGYYPGYALGPVGLSSYLAELNDDNTKEGANVYALFSTEDELIGYGDVVWGQYTSEWPTITSSVVYNTAEYTHMGIRDLTKQTQYSLITKHSNT